MMDRSIMDRVFVVGASAGGVAALSRLFGELDSGLPATIFVVIHRYAGGPDLLSSLLSKRSRIPIRVGANEPMKHGVIYLAPPDRHLIVERDIVRTTNAARENRHRPSIDVLFRSAAVAYRQTVVGVVLTGMLDDGTAGLFYVKRHGGITVVQDPADAEFDSMPANALTHVKIDHIVPLDRMGNLLNSLAREPIAYPTYTPEGPASMPKIFVRPLNGSEVETRILEEDEQSAKPSTYTCPECHGTLFRLNDLSTPRYRCRVGHAYGTNSLAVSQTDQVEQLLWSALHAIEEKAEYESQLGEAAAKTGDAERAANAANRVKRTKAQSKRIQNILSSLTGEQADATQ
jgi:two-component system, chemotaxis family, protein-glutamate methylesterase/glutaminase